MSLVPAKKTKMAAFQAGERLQTENPGVKSRTSEDHSHSFLSTSSSERATITLALEELHWLLAHFGIHFTVFRSIPCLYF